MLHHWFDKKPEAGPTASASGLVGPRVPRHSGAWATLRKRLQSEPGLRILDTGYTSPANINYLTTLGHSVFLADLVHDAYAENWQTGADEDGNPVWNVEGYLNQTLNFSANHDGLADARGRIICCHDFSPSRIALWALPAIYHPATMLSRTQKGVPLAAAMAPGNACGQTGRKKALGPPG